MAWPSRSRLQRTSTQCGGPPLLLTADALSLLLLQLQDWLLHAAHCADPSCLYRRVTRCCPHARSLRAVCHPCHLAGPNVNVESCSLLPSAHPCLRVHVVTQCCNGWCLIAWYRYVRLDNDAQVVQNKSGVIFFILINQSMLGTFGVLQVCGRLSVQLVSSLEWQLG